MKVTLESTTKIVTINGVPARIWEGFTDTGVQVHAYITRVGVTRAEHQTAFETELQACRSPSPEIEAIPHRVVL